MSLITPRGVFKGKLFYKCRWQYSIEKNGYIKNIGEKYMNSLILLANLLLSYEDILNLFRSRCMSFVLILYNARIFYYQV